jgi:TPR repeat protein
MRYPRRLLTLLVLMPAICESLFAQAPSFAETKKLAEAGDAHSQSNLGSLYREGKGAPKDEEEAVKWFRKAADQGNAEAQCKLGCMYFLGKGVPKDEEEAAKWFRKAADQGDAEAPNYLGIMYVNGENYAEAVKWFRKAADQGNAEAQFNIGLMCGKGQGMPRDYVEAYAWFNIAAVSIKSLKDARDGLILTPDERARGQKRSKELFNEIEARKKAAGK